MTVLGAVLAGGASRRFGADKAFAHWRGRPLIEHAANCLTRHCDQVVIVGHRLHGFPSVPDLPQPGMGPLGGLAGALHAARDRGFASVVTAPCDVPTPPESLFEALHRAPAYCREHPVFGHWPVSIADRLDRWLAQEADLSVAGFARAVGALPVSTPEQIEDVDTPRDLERLS